VLPACRQAGEPTELIARVFISKAIANIMFFFYSQKFFKVFLVCLLIPNI
jgi:hypothetical protein